MLQNSRGTEGSHLGGGTQIFDDPFLGAFKPNARLDPMEVKTGCHTVALDEWDRDRPAADLESPHLGLEGQHLTPIQSQLNFLRRKLLPAEVAQTAEGHLFGHDAPGCPETDALKLHGHSPLSKGLEQAVLEALGNADLVQVGSQSDDQSQN